MNREELIGYLAGLQDFSPVPPDLFEQLEPKVQQGQKPRKNKSKKISLPNPLRSKLLDYVSTKEKGYVAFIGYTAFSIAANVSIHCMREPSRLQLSEMIEITGGAAPFMEKFVNNGMGLELDMVPSPRLRPAVFILAAALEAAMAEQGKRKEENSSLIRLQKLADYMRERGLLLCWDVKSDEDWYVEYVIDHAENILKRECIANSLSLAYKLMKKRLMEIEAARDAAITHIKKEQKKPPLAPLAPLANPQSVLPIPTSPAKDLLTKEETMAILNLMDCDQKLSDKTVDVILDRVRQTLPPSVRGLVDSSDRKFKELMRIYDEFLERVDECRDRTKAEEETMMRTEYLPAVAEDAFRAIVSGDDEIFKLKIGRYIWQDFMSQCDIPVPVVFYEDLEDDEEWDNLSTDCNGKLGLRIYDEDDLISMRTDSMKGIESIRLPLSSALAKYSGRAVGSHFYIRKSYIKVFKDAGYSDRRARDFAVILGTLAEVDRLETAEYKLDRENLFEGLESVESTDEEAPVEKKATEELERRLAQSQKDNQVCRHEISMLQRKNDALEREIQRLKSAIAEQSGEADEPTEMEPEEKIEFPYRTNLKVVVYGGFEVFHKSLMEFLPDARIVESAAHIDVTPVRNADIVFLQTNKTGHSGFWTVCDACKSNGVPYIYLNYASARRCAEVIVNEIKKIEK